VRKFFAGDIRHERMGKVGGGERDPLQERDVHFFDVHFEKTIHERIFVPLRVLEVAIPIPPLDDSVVRRFVGWKLDLFMFFGH